MKSCATLVLRSTITLLKFELSVTRIGDTLQMGLDTRCFVIAFNDPLTLARPFSSTLGIVNLMRCVLCLVSSYVAVIVRSSFNSSTCTSSLTSVKNMPCLLKDVRILAMSRSMALAT